MTALKIIGIILLIFLLIGFLCVGAIVSFGDELRVRLRMGAVRLTIFPRKQKPKKPKKEKPETEGEKEKKPKKKRALPKPSFDELLDLIETAFSALGATARRACRRVRIDPLEVTVVFGGYDPANVAMAFGAANTAMYAVMPRAEETFYIPDPSLHLRMNYDAEQTEAEGSVGLSLRVCDLLAILFTLAIPLAKWFLRFKRAHKADTAAHRGAPAAQTEQEDTVTEEQIA